MPMKWVPPEAYLMHRGITIYHTYKEGSFEQRWEYWYTTSETESDDYEFDARDLPGEGSSDTKIRNAIDKKLLKLPKEVRRSVECHFEVNGLTVLFEATEANMNGTSYVRVEDKDGNEEVYWDAAEFAEDPVGCLGAFLSCIYNGS